MTETATAQGHPHHVWCERHDATGGGVLCHFGAEDRVYLEDGAVLSVSLDRSTCLQDADQHEPEPRVYLSRDHADLLRMTIKDAQALRGALGDAIRNARTPEIPADAEHLDGRDHCPSWCVGADVTDDPDWHGDGRHIGWPHGPRNWFVRRSLLRAPGERVARTLIASRKETIELAYADDTPFDIDPPTARSIAAALIRAADEAESLQ